jgi:hypothetical protein
LPVPCWTMQLPCTFASQLIAFLFWIPTDKVTGCRRGRADDKFYLLPLGRMLRSLGDGLCLPHCGDRTTSLRLDSKQ